MGTDVKDLAISYWRLEKWVASAPVDKKLAATSSLRNIKKFLDDSKVVIVDPVGQPYDAGMAVDVVRNNMDEDDDTTPIISETVKPIVMQNDSVIMFGQVIIGKEVKVAPALKSTAETCEPEQVNSDTPSSNNADDHTKEKVKSNMWVKIAAVVLLLSLCLSAGSFVMQMLSLNKPQESVKDEIASISTQLNEIKAELSTNDISTELQTKLDKLLEEISSLENYDDAALVEKVDNLIAEVEALKNTDQSEGVQFIRHAVVAGDSLASICKKYGVNYYEVKRELLNFNNISDENEIYVGQVIYIPKV